MTASAEPCVKRVRVCVCVCVCFPPACLSPCVLRCMPTWLPAVSTPPPPLPPPLLHPPTAHSALHPSHIPVSFCLILCARPPGRFLLSGLPAARLKVLCPRVALLPELSWGEPCMDQLRLTHPVLIAGVVEIVRDLSSPCEPHFSSSSGTPLHLHTWHSAPHPIPSACSALTPGAALATQVSETDGQTYQLDMMRCLREVNVDNNTIGWYQSTIYGSYQTLELIDTYNNYAESIKRCVCIVYDPMQSSQGGLSLKAIKLKDKFMEVYKTGTQPRPPYSPLDSRGISCCLPTPSSALVPLHCFCRCRCSCCCRCPVLALPLPWSCPSGCTNISNL